jgi:hypothetical protein
VGLINVSIQIACFFVYAGQISVNQEGQKLSLRNRLLRVLLGFHPTNISMCISVEFFIFTCHFLSM